MWNVKNLWYISSKENGEIIKIFMFNKHREEKVAKLAFSKMKIFK